MTISFSFLSIVIVYSLKSSKNNSSLVKGYIIKVILIILGIIISIGTRD